ncbi:phosphotransferase family protein [Streptomyces albogriseolus]|uniref:phosphotransferase family protein n=1 Tax=Streptomyces albogriseolus TaxID=1887 RepID=UPI002259BEFC|nr:phosphotransferase [Streptomyces viridodiastaticus]MCX4624436.1 phosphotransferase [Streptomyces viridodiastaticus]
MTFDGSFVGAPRHLGFDEADREILSYLPGWVPARFQRWTDSQVAAADSLLRAFHDATSASRVAGRHPVVCHHDPGPNNTVFADDVPVAFIDFDTAAPGDPLEDLGYMAWTCSSRSACLMRHGVGHESGAGPGKHWCSRSPREQRASTAA